MYLDYLVDIPEVKGKITFRSKGNARYVYYEYDRIYDSDKKYTTVRRVTIGKVSADDESKMRPNENFKKFFPEVEVPEESDTVRSSCLKAGTYMVISKTVKDEYSNAIVHAFQKFKAPFSGKIVHIFPEQSAVI